MDNTRIEKPELGLVEWRVRETKRYMITRFERSSDLSCHSSETKGEYDNASTANEVAYALCKAEHERLGWDIGDERIKYPNQLPMIDDAAQQRPSQPSA